HLRVSSDRLDTAIVGSSLGGLVSACAGVWRPDVFGLVGALSPSTWWDGTMIIGMVRGTASSPVKPARGYVDIGDAGAVARELGPQLAARAAAHDAEDSFVADSYADFKKQRLFSAGVPAELGGGGASFSELCAMLNELGRHCGSSALALSMHTHLLATT